MHKTNLRLQVLWTRETYRNSPENLNLGREALFQQCIIKKDLFSRHNITVLNPDVYEASGHKGALDILKAKWKPSSLQLDANGNTSKMTYSLGDGSPISVQQTINSKTETVKKQGLVKQLGWLWGAVKKPVGAALISFVFGIVMGKVIFSSPKAAALNNTSNSLPSN